MSFALLVVFGGGIVGHCVTAADSPEKTSSEVPSFYVRAVTGALSGKSVCYVCRNGDRPVVIVLLKDLGPDAARLLKELDQVVNQHRADGLRCFAVLLSETPQRDSARLQTLAFEEKIEVPLTLVGDSTLQSTSLAVRQDTAITVVTYRDRRIVQRIAFKSGDCDEAGRQAVIDAAKALLEEKR